MSAEPASVADRVIAERQERARCGADLCREAIAEVTTRRGLERAEAESATVPDPAELVHRRALQRAATQRRTRSLTEETARV